MNTVFLVGCSLVALAQFVNSLVHKSIHWSPRNPIFRFTPEEFENGTAYFSMDVEQNSKITFICPHPSLVLRPTTEATPKTEMYENQWFVDKESFESCNVRSRSNSSINKLILNCSEPQSLKDDSQVFRAYSPEPNELVFPAGKEYFFLATSNGSQLSLQNMQGGHCHDTKNGISMRIKFYVCKKNDPKCNKTERILSSTPTTPITNIIEIGERASTAGQTVPWKILTILFGATLGVALIVIFVLSCICHASRKSKNRNEHRNENRNENRNEEAEPWNINQYSPFQSRSGN